MSCVAQEGVKNWDHGRVVVGTSAVQVIAAATQAFKGIQVKAGPNNAGIIYVGKSDVTDGDTVATDGYPLAAGEEIFIPTDNPSTVYAIASQAAQDLFFAYA